MRDSIASIATRLSRIAVFALIALSGCAEEPAVGPSGLPYCWTADCPTDPGAEVCGQCKNPGADQECPPGFVCSCSQECVKGPRSYDAIPGCIADAGAEPTPDAQHYDWPACDMSHLPGT